MNQSITQSINQSASLPDTTAADNAALPTGRDSLNQFFALCDAADARCYITWRGNWPNRAGVLNVLLDGGHKHLRFVYYRGRTGWRASDDKLHRLHTGSARHLAVMEASDALKHYLAERA